MTKQGEHNQNRKGKDPLSLIDGASVSWNKSKEDIWASMQDQLVEKNETRIISFSSRTRRLAVAAVIIILLGVPSLMRFYTRTIISHPGEHSEYILPDGSLVSMNAETRLTYKPLWWGFSRELSLEGEAFFDVEPGSRFRVRSELANTQVIGTSFNIISRNERYEVTCLSGKVKVSSRSNESEVFLEANQRALLVSLGNIEMQDIEEAKESISWIDNQFYFTSIPLEQVFEELERQYNIEIRGAISEDLIYTGNFTRGEDPEQALEIICMPFGIKFEALGNSVYLVSEDE